VSSASRRSEAARACQRARSRSTAATSAPITKWSAPAAPSAYFSEFGHFNTDNKLPNNAYRNKTYAGRFGGIVANTSDISASIRWIDRGYESPNGLSFFGTPDDASQTNRLYFVGLGDQTQITQKWQAAVHAGFSDQRAHFINPTLSGHNIGGTGFGDVVTITGANGYSVTGQGVLDYGPYDSQSRSARRGIYAQTT
jgi:iron complex outermembrane receptor protein/vitamin B12 transporter